MPIGQSNASEKSRVPADDRVVDDHEPSEHEFVAARMAKP
jgi:hypothetical protein